jgi:predicted phosphohydrolase
MRKFFSENNIKSLDILHNNSFIYNDVALCGTRGWLLEDDSNPELNTKITSREVSRLRASLDSAKEVNEKLCFLHYPPRFKNLIFQDLVDVMSEYGVKSCWYGHIHGDGFRYAVNGMVDGISYNMVSADYINFTPQMIYA